MEAIDHEQDRESRDLALVAMYEFREIIEGQGTRVSRELLCEVLSAHFSVAIDGKTLHACYRDAKTRIEKRRQRPSVVQAMQLGLTAFEKASGDENGS